MIQSFKHKGLKLLWEQGTGSKLPAGQISRIERMLDVIDSAQQVPEDFGAFQNWNIHKLTGDLKNYWSIKVNKNYRIIFHFGGNMLTMLIILIIINIIHHEKRNEKYTSRRSIA